MPFCGYLWEFKSGEQAILANAFEAGASLQESDRVHAKYAGHEPLSGRFIEIWKGDPESAIRENCGELLQQRPSKRKGCDVELIYDWWAVYFHYGRVVDVEFSPTTREPAPIYRWNGFAEKKWPGFATNNARTDKICDLHSKRTNTSRRFDLLFAIR